MEELKLLLTKLGIDASAAVEIEASVNASIATVKSGFKHTVPLTRLTEVINERNQLKGDIAERDATIVGFETKLKGFEGGDEILNTIKNENETLKKDMLGIRKTNWETIKDNFYTEVDGKKVLNDKANLIKDDFQFAEADKELTYEQLGDNIQAFSPYKKTKYFDSNGKPTTIVPPKDTRAPFGRIKTEPNKTYASPFEVYEEK